MADDAVSDVEFVNAVDRRDGLHIAIRETVPHVKRQATIQSKLTGFQNSVEFRIRFCLRTRVCIGPGM